MKFSKILLFGIFSVLLLILFVIYRRENMLQILAAFFALTWLVQVPGSLILILVENKTENRLRIILFGNVIGLTLAPLMYYALYYSGLQNSLDVAITVLNIILGLILMIRVRRKQLHFRPVDQTKLGTAMLLLAVVMIVCCIREFSQLLSWNFVINSKRDTDAGMLMSMVIGFGKYGYLANMNYGSVPVNYHHFIYLLMALVMKTSHIGILSVYQVVFPLYTFYFMTLAIWCLVQTIGVSGRVAILSAISFLFLDDFYLLNKILVVMTGYQPVFTIESIAWLHNSPSTTVSLMIMFVVIAELVHAEAGKVKNAVLFLLVVSIGTLACYKISTWACLMMGMMAASAILFRKNPKLVVATTLSLVSGFLVNKFLSGTGAENYSSGGMDFNMGYPVLRSFAVREFLNVRDGFTVQDLNLKIIVALAMLSVCYVAVVFGVRLFYIFRKTKEGIRKLDFTSATILFSALGGIFVSFLFTPKIGQHNALYFMLTGMYLLSVVSIPIVYEYLTLSKRFYVKAGLIMVLVIQFGSGVLQVLQPFTNPAKSSSLSPGWFEAMDYIRKNSDEHALLACNRFQLKENYYKDDFDFIPVYAERPVVVGGKQYFHDYELRKAKTDSLFISSSVEEIKRISGELKVNYILFDKWKGGSMPCRDSTYLLPVFSNSQIDIYKVNRH